MEDKLDQLLRQHNQTKTNLAPEHFTDRVMAKIESKPVVYRQPFINPYLVAVVISILIGCLGFIYFYGTLENTSLTSNVHISPRQIFGFITDHLMTIIAIAMSGFFILADQLYRKRQSVGLSL